MALVGMVTLIVLVLMGVHIAVALGTVGFFGLVACLNLPKAVAMVGIQAYSGIATLYGRTDTACGPVRLLGQGGGAQGCGRHGHIQGLHALSGGYDRHYTAVYLYSRTIHLYPQRYVYLIRLHPHFCHFERSYYHE